jgi:phosphoserine phosphatase
MPTDPGAHTGFVPVSWVSDGERLPGRGFDLDGTLLQGSTVSLLLARWLGQSDEISRLEGAFGASEISNRVVADTQAQWFAGCRATEVWRVLDDGPWIGGMAETFKTLREARVRLLLGTITWSFAAQRLRERYGFDAHCGTEMPILDGVLSGTVSRHFDEFDKALFVRQWCTQNGYSLQEVAAVGDSRSDIPLFGEVGMSIALNATSDARESAAHVLDTEDLRDVLAHLQRDG